MYGDEALRTFPGEFWAASDVGGGLGAQWGVVSAKVRAKLRYVEVVDEPGLCTRPGRVNSGLNSGYQAIGLAYMWGAARIVLLGYDMQRGPQGESHHHGDHERDLPNLGTLPEWTRRTVQLGVDLRAHGVEVINATRRTAITCFERASIESVLTPPKLYLKGMQGLGDNIYQRAVVRELTVVHDIWLETPWPELYADLPIHCVRVETQLRTQAKNVARRTEWAVPPRELKPRQITYSGADGSQLEGLCAALGVKADRLTFDLPPLPEQDREPYIVIRPATVRTEWPAEARNPLPEYLAMAAETLRRHFRIVSVADLSPGAEWPVLPLPYADETYHAGELGVEELLALIAGAAGVVGGVGWLVPAAVAARVPMFLIYGGWGRSNGPARIFDRRMDVSLIEQAIPDRFCGCGNRNHACDKRISGIGEQIERWTMGLLALRAPAMVAGGRDRILPSHRAAV